MGVGAGGPWAGWKETLELSDSPAEVNNPPVHARSQVTVRPGGSLNVQRALSIPRWKGTLSLQAASVLGPLTAQAPAFRWLLAGLFLRSS